MGLGATVVLVISGTRDRQGTDEGGGRQLKEGPTGRVGGSLSLDRWVQKIAGSWKPMVNRRLGNRHAR